VAASGLELCAFLQAAQLSQFECQLLDMGATLSEDLDEITDEELSNMGMNKLQVRQLRRLIDSGQAYTPAHASPCREDQTEDPHEEERTLPPSDADGAGAKPDTVDSGLECIVVDHNEDTGARTDALADPDGHCSLTVARDISGTEHRRKEGGDNCAASETAEKREGWSNLHIFGPKFAAGIAAAADREYAVAIVLFEEVLQTRPNDARCAYHLLCCHAQVEGHSSQALQWFSRAIEWGLKHLADLKPAHDSALHTISSLPEFQSLLQTLASQRQVDQTGTRAEGSPPDASASSDCSSDRKFHSSGSSRGSKRRQRRSSRHSSRRSAVSQVSSQTVCTASSKMSLQLRNEDAAMPKLGISGRAGSGLTSSRNRPQPGQQVLLSTGFSWAKLKECKLSVLMELLRTRDPPQALLDRVLDSHAPRHAAVRMLRRYERTGAWPEIDAVCDAASETGSAASSKSTAHESESSIVAGTGCTKSVTGSQTTIASSQTETASAGSSPGDDSSDSTMNRSTSSESDSETVHPLVHEAADAVWFKLQLDGGQRDRSPAQVFAAARDILAMPRRPKDVSLDEEALLLCLSVSIEVVGLQEHVQRHAKFKEMVKDRKMREKQDRNERKAHAKAIKLLRNEIDDTIGCGKLQFCTFVLTAVESVS
jgi:hypothetical protein